mmetsp:Transcript_5702/g.20064  ORF Transcript_5702/g.20064 Transcript_5702/m.20064 type:complete len:399 (-) Transcript_5702:413-1609(-)
MRRFLVMLPPLVAAPGGAVEGLGRPPVVVLAERELDVRRVLAHGVVDVGNLLRKLVPSLELLLSTRAQRFFLVGIVGIREGDELWVVNLAPGPGRGGGAPRSIRKHLSLRLLGRGLLHLRLRSLLDLLHRDLLGSSGSWLGLVVDLGGRVLASKTTSHELQRHAVPGSSASKLGPLKPLDRRKVHEAKSSGPIAHDSDVGVDRLRHHVGDSSKRLRGSLHVGPVSSSVVVVLSLVHRIPTSRLLEGTVSLLIGSEVLGRSSDGIVVRVDPVVAPQVASRNVVLVQVLRYRGTEAGRTAPHVKPLSSSVVIGLALVDWVPIDAPCERSVALLSRGVVLGRSSDGIVVRVNAVVASKVASRNVVLVQDKDLSCPGVLSQNLMRLVRVHPPKHWCLVNDSR